MNVLIGLGLLLAAALVGTVIGFRRPGMRPFLKLLMVVAVIYVALAFVLELGAVMIERGQQDLQEFPAPVPTTGQARNPASRRANAGDGAMPSSSRSISAYQS